MEKFKPFIIPVALLVLIDQMVKIVISKVFMKYEFDIIAKVLRFNPELNTRLSYAGNFFELRFYCGYLLNKDSVAAEYAATQITAITDAISGKKSTYKFLGKNDNDLWHIGMFM